MSQILDPEEALGGPLYLVAMMLVMVPVVDFLLSVPPPELSSVRWRFAALGLLSGFTLLPVLGLALAFVVSAILKHHALQRVLVLLCLTSALGFIALSVTFFRDIGTMRNSIPEDGMPAFRSAASRAMIKLGFTSLVLAYLGWRARRMSPAPSRHKTPKPVHVISK